METNVFTKKSDYYYEVNENFIENDEVKNLYQKYKGKCENYLMLDSADFISKSYYVYAWHTKTDPKKYFYVGKGKGSRYRHILYEIKKVENGKKNERFEHYKTIKDFCGIESEFLLKNLTEYEALIYEQCVKLDFIEKGEVLLCVEGMPDDYYIAGWYKSKNKSGNFSPKILKEHFYERYLNDYNIPYFDEVEHDALLLTYFYPYFIDENNNEISKNKAIIEEWLTSNNARIYKTVSTKTASIIVQDTIMYPQYKKYRTMKKLIFSSTDVIDYINHNK